MPRQQTGRKVRKPDGADVKDYDTELTVKKLARSKRRALEAFEKGRVVDLLHAMWLITRAYKVERQHKKRKSRKLDFDFDSSDAKRSCLKLSKAVLFNRDGEELAPLLHRERACLMFLRMYACLMEGLFEFPITGRKVGLAALPLFGNAAQIICTIFIFVVIPEIISCPHSVLNRVIAQWAWGSTLNFIPGYAMIRKSTPPNTFMCQTLIAYLMLRRYMANSELWEYTDRYGRQRNVYVSYDLEEYFDYPVEYHPKLHKVIVGDTRRQDTRYASKA